MDRVVVAASVAVVFSAVIFDTFTVSMVVVVVIGN